MIKLPQPLHDDSQALVIPHIPRKDDVWQAGEFAFLAGLPDRNAGEHLPHDGGPVNSQRLGAHIAGGDAAFGDEERGTQREVRDNGGDGVRDLSGDTQLLFRTGAAGRSESGPAGCRPPQYAPGRSADPPGRIPVLSRRPAHQAEGRDAG